MRVAKRGGSSRSNTFWVVAAALAVLSGCGRVGYEAAVPSALEREASTTTAASEGGAPVSTLDGSASDFPESAPDDAALSGADTPASADQTIPGGGPPDAAPEAAQVQTPFDAAVSAGMDLGDDLGPDLQSGAAFYPDSSASLGAGLVGYWRLDESAGTTATDSSGLANHGTYVNDPTPSSMVAPVMFQNPRSLLLDQSTRQAVTVPDAPSLSLTGPFTLAAWVFLTADTISTSTQGIIEKWEWDGKRAHLGFFLRLDAEQRPRVATIGTRMLDDVAPAAPVPRQTWTHLAGVFDGSSLRVYVNGAEQARLDTTVAPEDGSSPVEIGRAMGVGTFHGLLDDVRIYARALSAADVGALAAGAP